MRSLAGHYHGATLGALGVTGWDERRAPWTDLLGPRLDGLPEPGGDCAALIAETIPVAGAGVRIPEIGQLSRRRAACDAAGALWIADEVLTGFGRCGAMFAWQRLAEREDRGGAKPDAAAIPDLVVFGKGAGGGYAALAGVLLSGRVAEALDRAEAGGGRPFTHYQTYGGNPIACAVGRAVLRSLREERWLARVRGWEEELRRVVEGAGESAEAIGMLAGFTGPGAWGDYAARGALVHAVRGTHTVRGTHAAHESGAVSANRFVLAPPFPLSMEGFDELRDALRVTSPRGR